METPRQYENVNIDNFHETSEVSSLSHLGVICILYVCITFVFFFLYLPNSPDRPTADSYEYTRCQKYAHYQAGGAHTVSVIYLHNYAAIVHKRSLFTFTRTINKEFAVTSEVLQA